MNTVKGRGSFILLMAIAAPVFSAQDYKASLSPDHPAIQYGTRPVNDRVHAVIGPIGDGTASGVPHDLPSLLPEVLRRLGIGTESQMLVFSKTSLHASHISPSHPRAVYFADDVAVAYVPGAPTIEFAALDPTVGPVFYALSANGTTPPTLARSTACLRCHQGPATSGVPGIYVGSVIPGPSGAPLRDDSAIITGHQTPFRDRWGGWFVTARRGEPVSRANAVAFNPAAPDELTRDTPPNLVTMAGRVDRTRYLTATSDIVALMTFEHQTEVTNLLTRVAWEARIGAPVASVDAFVASLLFSGEAPLTEPVEGVTGFAASFAAREPRDRLGRSLREFDLRTRLFRYPLSYMIYSASFDALPRDVRDDIYRRLHTVLTTREPVDAFRHLTTDDRRAILEIVRETKANLPSYW